MKKTYTPYNYFLFSILVFLSSLLNAQISWPEGQLLPSFPASASTQDLIYINNSTPIYSKAWTWQAESDEISHATGRPDTDGWVCEPGIDAVNQYMIYGPYDRNVTAGPNYADFRILIDNNSINDEPVVELHVRNNTTGVVLASRAVTRKQFNAANAYAVFTVDFQMPADSQAIELRVNWKGNAKIKVDYVRVRQDNRDAEMYLISSLKGIVNKTQPRIFSYEGDAFAEGPYTWLNSLGVKYVENKSSNLNTLQKYLSEISGLIVYDPAQNHTTNLAIVLANKKNALIASPSFVSLLTGAPYNLPVLEDLRGKFTNKLQIYQKLYDEYWPNIDKRVLIGLSPDHHKASLREYAVALGAAVIWLDPKVTAESDMLNKFFASMPAGSKYLGWWPEEAPGVRRGSDFGIPTIPGDYCTNLTFHSGMPRKIDAKPMVEKPVLQNKIYVAFILSDGDNLQFVEHLVRKIWNNPDRGSVPMGWTMSPAMVDAMPGALNYYHKTSTENDNIISGPSGFGYTYPTYWPSVELLNGFTAKTEEYNVKAGMRVVTVWNTITGGISRTTGVSFAQNAPTLLGMTAQNTGGPLTIYNSSLPGQPLSCNYCTNEQAMKDHIASASSLWNGTSPRFVIIQAQPWNNVTPTSFKNVMNSLDTRYQVVRPDQIFQLIREANGLPVNPGGIEGSGDGITGTYFNGSNFETEVATRIDDNIDFNWDIGSPMPGVNENRFSVRWTGQVQPRFSGTYTFYSTADNGAKLWVNDQLIIDNWIGLTGSTYSGTIDLVAGEKYNLKLEYYENSGTAGCKLEWASPMQSREAIPKSQLYKDIVSGVNKNFSETEIKIYPIPATKGVLNVSLPNHVNEESVVRIYNVYGNEMMHEIIKKTDNQIDISSLQKGIYILNINNGNFSKSIRYIVN